MRQDSTPAPKGETPPCQCGHALNQHLLAGGHCEQRGCACRLFVIPLPPARERGEATPAPASGETPAYCAKCGGFAGQHDCTPTPSRPEGETAKHHTLGYLNPTGLFRPNTTPQGCSPTPSRPEGETPLVETCPRCREVGACRCVPGLITPIPARPEGETARCSGCGDEYGHLGPCNPDPYMGSPTPAPASGEEELAWLRIRDVRQPQSGKSRCCGTWELVEPALVISVRERDAILARDARLTARIAELEREPRPLPAGLATVEALLDYVQSAGVENPEPIRQRLRAALRAERERVVRWCWKEWSGGMRYDFDEEAEVTRALADLDKEATR